MSSLSKPAAAEGRLGGAVDLVPLGVEDRHAAHPGTHLPRLLQQAHPPDDIESDTAYVHGLPSGARARGALDDGGREAAAVQPVGKHGPGDSAAGDENGLHGKLLRYAVRKLNVRRTHTLFN